MRFYPTLVLSTSALALALGIASPALAQDATLPVCAEGQTENCSPVEAPVADPSPSKPRSRATPLSSPARASIVRRWKPTPLTSVSVNELTDTGDVSLGDALNDLPSLRSTFSQGTYSLHRHGRSGLLDLRGLGTSRTLVLVNGRRHVTASPGDAWSTPTQFRWICFSGLTWLPAAGFGCLRIGRGCGRVNFILRRDSRASRSRVRVARRRGVIAQLLHRWNLGTTFSDDRGNVAVSAEYAKSEPLYFKQRDSLAGAYSGRCQFQTVEPTGGEPFGTDGIFDTEFICGVKNGSLSDGGTIGRVGLGEYLRFDEAGNLFVDVPEEAFRSRWICQYSGRTRIDPAQHRPDCCRA